jgi:hypothetical protein
VNNYVLLTIIIFLTTNGEIFTALAACTLWKRRKFLISLRVIGIIGLKYGFFLYRAVKTYFFLPFCSSGHVKNVEWSWIVAEGGRGRAVKCDIWIFLNHHSDRWCLWLIPDSLLEHSVVKFIWQFSVVYS